MSITGTEPQIYAFNPSLRKVIHNRIPPYFCRFSVKDEPGPARKEAAVYRKIDSLPF